MRVTVLSLSLLLGGSLAERMPLDKRAAKVTSTILSTISTNVGLTTDLAIASNSIPTTVTIIPNQLTMTFSDSAYIYLETSIPTTTVSTMYTTITASSTTAKTTATTKKTSTTTSKTTSITTSKAPSITTSKATSTSTNSAASSTTQCDMYLSGSVPSQYIVSSNGDLSSACESQCQSLSTCKAWSTLTLSGGSTCNLYNTSVSLLMSKYLTTEPAGYGQIPIYQDIGCIHTLPKGTKCDFETDGPTTAGEAYFITRQWPYGDGWQPCYHSCLTISGCQSYYWEGQSSDDEGNLSSVCSFYSAPVSKVFVAGSSGYVASDAACIPDLDY